MDYQNKEQYAKYIGRILDSRYKLVKVIGEGSSAVVFKADDLRTGRPVAVKVLKPEHAKDVKAVKRFENECKVISMLSHDSIVRVVDVSIGNHSKYIVMEYIDGITLRQYMDGMGALRFEEIMDFCEQILSALEHAHSKGIIHRDIKPQNIMLLPKGEVKITDFGIAQVNDDALNLMADRAAGTAYYISPEQAAGGDVDARSDIYSLGVMMYEMATGHLPFDGADVMTIAKKQITEKPTPPSDINPEIPNGLEAMILMAMEKMPDARFKDASEMLKYLYKIKSRPNAVPRISEKRKKQQKKPVTEKVAPSHSSTPVIWGVACALLFLAIIAGYHIFSNLLFADKTRLVSKEVPDFVGTIYSENGMVYEEEYFEINADSIIFEYDENTEPYTIIEQNPKGGSYQRVVADTKKCEIILTVSLGAKTITIPDYSLIDSREAELLLRQQGFKVVIEEEYNPMVAAGLVINTVPSVGEKAVEGSEIILKVSTGFVLENTTVPNFVGLTEVEVQKLIEEKGMKVGKVTYTRSGEKVGLVLVQSINADAIFTYSNITIDFIVSGGTGYDTNYVPDVEGLTRGAAQAMLWRFGLSAGKITIERSNNEENTVIKQSYGPNSTIPGDLKIIDLTLSGGSSYTPSWIVVKIPNLLGKTEDGAREALTNQRAALGNVTYKFSNTVPAGQVIEQSIPADTLRSGYPYEVYVDIVISRGPGEEEETTPSETVPSGGSGDSSTTAPESAENSEPAAHEPETTATP